MSFLTEVNGGTAAGTKSPSTKSSFLNGIETDSTLPERQSFAADQQVAHANTEYANSFTGIAKNTLEELAAPFVAGYKDAAAQVQPKSLDPRVASNVLTTQFANSLTDAGNKVYDAVSTLKDSHATLLQKGVGVGEAALGTLGPIFTALTAPLTYASSYPVIGQVADKVNELFSALGSGAGSYATTALVDDMPLSQQTKDTIRPLVHDVASLAAQLYAGKAGADALGTIASHGKAILSSVADDVKANPPVNSTTPLFHGADADTAASIRANGFQGSTDFPGNGMVSLTNDFEEANHYATLDGGKGEVLPVNLTGDNVKTYPSMADYEAALEKAPGDSAGAKEQALNAGFDAIRIKGADGKPDLVLANPKSLQISGETGDVSRGTAVPVAPDEVKAPGEAPAGAPRAPGVPAATTEPVGAFLKGVNGTKTPDLGTPEKGTSRLASNVETNAIERKLTTSFGSLPEYDKADLKVQAERAADVISSDPARAMRIALGQELPPKGILPGAIFNAVEDRAVKAGDVETLRRLATESTLSVEASKAGQTIRILGERDQLSPVKIIEDVKKARTETLEKRVGKGKAAATKKATVNEIRASIKTAAKAARPTWEEFMKELTCN